MAGGIVKGVAKGVSKAISKGGRKATKKAAWETGEQFFKRMDKDGVVPEILSDITRSDMIEQINIQQGSDNVDLENMFRGYADGNTDAHQAVMDYTTTLSGASHYQQNYTRFDAMYNLQQAGLNPPKGGGLYGRKNTRRTIQGPVPPQLADKTFDQGAQSYEEAVMLGTTKFTEDGVPKQIRNYGSDTAPHGRVTGVGVRKTSGRGTYARLEAEKLLTLGDDVKGFYQNKIPGHDDAHHWNPIGIMKKVVDGMSKSKRNAFIQEIQDELGLFSGNHIANLRQLNPQTHRWLHRRLETLGYNPASLKSFKGKSIQARKAYLKKFAEDLNKLDEELFSEMQISKGNRPGPQLQ